MPGGSAMISNSEPNEFYTKLKLIKNGLYCNEILTGAYNGLLVEQEKI